MATLNFIEKKQIEELLEMSSGYVLDFSNKTFQEFIYEIIGIDIYLKYKELSKAKILRAIFTEYDNIVVGKLLLSLLHYMRETRKITEINRDSFLKCADIGNKLIGKKVPIQQTQSRKTEVEPIVSPIDFDNCLKELNDLISFPETPQARGFAFEKFLLKLFELNALKPRGSFKLIGEQIDGSFLLHNETYLLEAKWTNKLTIKSDLVNFNEKVSSKSSFTRGLFISYSGFSNEAIQTFAMGRKVSIILMTVNELYNAIYNKKNLQEVLSTKVRALAEEGNFFYEVT